jgi:hypothetical protein
MTILENTNAKREILEFVGELMNMLPALQSTRIYKDRSSLSQIAKRGIRSIDLRSKAQHRELAVSQRANEASHEHFRRLTKYYKAHNFLTKWAPKASLAGKIASHGENLYTMMSMDDCEPGDHECLDKL